MSGEFSLFGKQVYMTKPGNNHSLDTV